MKKALINLLNALADRVRPCKHKWHKVKEITTDHTWYGAHAHTTMDWYFICENCGKDKRIHHKPK
jgi:hypothetical protein